MQSPSGALRHAFQALATIASGPTGEATAQFRIGLGSLPYLADHGVQDMVVLAGAFYVEMALYMERERSGRIPRVVRNVRFHNPVLLAEEDTVIRVEAKPGGEYAFYEAGGQALATLEIERGAAVSLSANPKELSIAFQAQAFGSVDGEGFYSGLRANGNQFGPRFRRIESIWRAGEESLARLDTTTDATSGCYCLHPSLLDSTMHPLAAFVGEGGKTFVLESIDRIEIGQLNLPGTLWAHAKRAASTDGDHVRGDVRLLDGAGKPHLALDGVVFRLLERAAGSDAATRLVVAANFTAEPLEEAIGFWGEHFGVPLRVEFAPYNQVFQQLLGAESALRSNRGGANAILLRLEEWVRDERARLARLTPEKAQQCFGKRARRVLPNGLEIAHLNPYETDYVYKEIFEDQAYLRHGIELRDGDTVFDIGANIGLFSLFVLSRCKNPTIYAFEPAPVVHDLLKANCEAYGSGKVHALQLGVSDCRKSAEFTFYETSSVFSGFRSDEGEDRAAIQNVVRNMLNRLAIPADSIDQYIEELTADRLKRQNYECRLTSVSDIIRERGIERIDLLKVDAEKSELDILRGIADCDWPKIRQIVMEIHDPSREAIKAVEARLTEKGFRCSVVQETLLEHAGLFNLYAIRDEAAAPAARAAERLQRNVRDFCAALGAFQAKAAAPLLLCICPRTSTAELDVAEQALLAGVSAIPNVHPISSSALARRYPLENYYDSHADQAGHVPYTPEAFAAIGTALVRGLFNLNCNPYKVIVLDCDNTLWKGVCGEEGAAGLELTAPHRALQEFMVEQAKAGMLLCLCSKNSERDVLEVFERRGDMPLKLEHLVAWRVNWASKSENIKSLAEELGVGLDSFVFIDDNPVECADVIANCPAVLTLQLPRDGASVGAFLNHVWAFDRTAATREDEARTRMYRESAMRRQYQSQALSLKEFIEGLELRLELSEPAPAELARVSQLTQRTNQFNLTTVRRSEDEIRAFLRRPGARCLTARVSDRFGDYGLVGVVLYESQDDRYDVDTLLLSCRALGRGVEHALAAQLGKRALEEGKRAVRFGYRPTERNAPALGFMTSIGEGYREADSWTLPADYLARLTYQPDAPQAAVAEDASEAAPRPRSAFGLDDVPVRLRRIAENLYDVGRLAKAIERHRLGRQAPAAADNVPGSTLETTLANIWKRVLARPRLGLDDNFFDAGGTSLKAVQVVAAIKRELGKALSIVSLFESPTVRLLAARLGAPAAETPINAPSAASRGQRRRTRLTRERA